MYETVGITSKQNIRGKIDGIPFIPQSDIPNVEFDYMIVTSNKYFSEILSTAIKMGIDPNKLIRQDIIKQPGFTFEKYIQLRESKLSIISKNCFGGFLYHRFGLPFLSPTINLFQSSESFLKMVSNFEENIHLKLKFYDIAGRNKIYPIYSLGDSKINMLHYNNFDEAEQKWYERVKRINWNNLLFVMHTDSEDELQQFDSLPYDKKVCFTSFKSNLKSAFYLPFIDVYDKLVFYVNFFASGIYPFYDIWDLMLYGRKTPRIDLE